MKNVKNFIRALGENYYPEFLVNPYSELVQYDEHFVLVEYQNKSYYENSLNFIRVRQQAIIIDLKRQYENALSQIFLKLATTRTETFDSFIKFNIEAVKISLKTIKSDFYVDNKQSRYHSILIDNLNINDINILSKRDVNLENYPKDGTILRMFESISGTKNTYAEDYFSSNYYLGFHNLRLKTLSWLPFALFHIGNRFIMDLVRIQDDINRIRLSNKESARIKWLGKRTHIGYIFSKLAQEGYIETPKLKNGEVNYTAFARLIKELFEVEVAEGTLRKYLNPLDDKFEENRNTFEKEQFYLPNVKLVT